MGIISLIVHTWGGVDKSKAVCPQRGPCMLTRRLMLVCTLLGFWCLALTILLCFGVIEINAIFVQLCGLSPIYVATHEPGHNTGADADADEADETRPQQSDGTMEQRSKYQAIDL